MKTTHVKTTHVLGLLLATAFAAGPALAQTTAPGGGNQPAVGSTTTTTTTTSGAPGATGGMTGGGADSSSHNTVLAANGDIRSAKVIGSSVYNDKNEKLGSVDDILLGKDQKASQAVISVGGVLGVGAKLVAVPYDKLKFPETVDNNTAQVTMPGVTADSLNGMPTFHYASK